MSDTIIEETREWERFIRQIGWIAPITIDQLACEVLEASEAKTAEERASEFGDIFHVLVRLAEREGIDIASAARASLERNKDRTDYCIRLNNWKVPQTPEHTAKLWAVAKQREKNNADKR